MAESEERSQADSIEPGGDPRDLVSQETACRYETLLIYLGYSCFTWNTGTYLTSPTDSTLTAYVIRA